MNKRGGQSSNRRRQEHHQPHQVSSSGGGGPSASFSAAAAAAPAAAAVTTMVVDEEERMMGAAAAEVMQSELFNEMAIHPPNVAASDQEPEDFADIQGFAEESGYSDLFGEGCPNNFDIVSFITDNNGDDFSTPVDSPADQQQQHRYQLVSQSQQPQQMEGVAFLHHHNHQRQPQLIAEQGGPPPQQLLVQNLLQQQQHQLHQHHQNGGTYIVAPAQLYQRNNPLQQPQQLTMAKHSSATHLPDSPPITEVLSNGGASSISPSGTASTTGGSAGGGFSPFSPQQYHQQQQLRQQQMGMGGQPQQLTPTAVGGGGSSGVVGYNQQRQHPALQRMGSNGNGGGLQQQVSPQSEFLSPYPPSQSTPGSQHSCGSGGGDGGSGSAQVSPPGGTMFPMPHAQLIPQQQRRHGGYGSGNSSSGPSSGSCSLRSVNGSEIDLNAAYQAAIQQPQQRNNGQPTKRRRVNSLGGGIEDNIENIAAQLQQASHMPSVKTEGGFIVGGGGNGGSGNHHRRSFGRERSSNNSSGGDRPSMPPSRNSFDDMYGSEDGSTQKTIKFFPFFAEAWSPLYNYNHRELSPLNVAVVADKGFNYSAQDGCFVNQKKNHFQITTNIVNTSTLAGAPDSTPQQPVYVRMPNANGELQPVQDFGLMFCGAKSEMPTSEISIKQSQTDRRPIPHEPVRFQLDVQQPQTKQTVPRLHFSETTMNNHRKNGKPNPEQKYFLLVVKLMAYTPMGPVLVQSYQSDRVIVRASNPGQFEQPDTEFGWQKSSSTSGNQPPLLHYAGQVAIGMERPIQDAMLTVGGTLVTTGPIAHPSDRRLKDEIAEVDTHDAMERVNQMRIVEFAYKPGVAQQWGLTTEASRHRVGVIAQELAEVLPDAVRDNGDFLTVDDTRVFYDTVAAAQELYRLTGNLECKIDQVERISAKLARFAQKRRAQLGSAASGLSDFSSTLLALDASDKTATGEGGGMKEDEKMGRGEKGKKGNGYGKENRSYLSSLSLASTVQSTFDHDFHHPRRNNNKHNNSPGGFRRRCASSTSTCGYGYSCRRGTGSNNNGGGSTGQLLCNSRLTQGTIVTLVAVMAVCLVAMCSLYVLDWYNRTYVYGGHGYYPHHPPPPASMGVGHGLEPGKMSGLINWHPPKVRSNSPPLAAVCGRKAQGTSLSCPMYCCGNSAEYATTTTKTKQQQGVGDGEEEEEEKSGGRKGRKGVVDNIDSVISLPTRVEGKREELDHIVSPSSTTTSLLSAIPLESGVRIEVMNVGVELDTRYCASNDEGSSSGNSCDWRRGLYNLYVPISPYLPTIPLTLKISVEEGMFVDNCGILEGFNHKQCELFGAEAEEEEGEEPHNSGAQQQNSHYAAPNGRPTSSRLLGDNVFELSVGSYLQSAYRFRVGHSTESCSMPEDQQGRSFDEYNLIFYRQCSSPTPPTSGSTSTSGKNISSTLPEVSTQPVA